MKSGNLLSDAYKNRGYFNRLKVLKLQTKEELPPFAGKRYGISIPVLGSVEYRFSADGKSFTIYLNDYKAFAALPITQSVSNPLYYVSDYIEDPEPEEGNPYYLKAYVTAFIFSSDYTTINVSDLNGGPRFKLPVGSPIIGLFVSLGIPEEIITYLVNNGWLLEDPLRFLPNTDSIFYLLD